MSTHRPSPRRGFTLIELLVVIAILGLLMGMLFPALSSAIRTAKRSKATSHAKQIASAVELFVEEYGYLPVPRTEQGYEPGPGGGNFGNEQIQPFTAEESRKIMMTLMAIDDGYNNNDHLNPKKKVFLDMEEAELDGTLLDPWGNQYRIKLDRDFNGKIEYYSDPIQYHTRAVVVSAGSPGWITSASGDSPEDPNKLVANVELDVN